MKKIMLPVLILMAVICHGQSAFKYQARVNVVPLDKFYYAGAFRIGIETVNRKWNYGIDYLFYNASSGTTTGYSADPMSVHMTENYQYINVTGLALNVMRSLNFKMNANRLIYGLQGFAGKSTQTNTITAYTLDTFHFQTPPGTGKGYSWYSSDLNGVTEKHGGKLALGIIPFIRLELAINKRFTFTPEFMLPIMFMNHIGGSSSMDFNPGLNFCLGYRLGKI